MNQNKNKYNEIKAPASADIAIEKGIRMGERHFRFRRNIASLVTVAAICVIIMISGFVSPTMASVLVKLPVVGPIFEKSVDKGLKSISEKGLSDSQNMEITSNGITVAIKEIYYDISSISIGYVVGGVDAESKYFNFFLYYNGEMIPGGGTGTYSMLSKDAYSGIMTLFINGGLPESFDLRIVAAESLDEKSPYDFTIPVSREKVDPESKEVAIMKYQSSDDNALLVKKAVFTPASTTIYYEYSRPEDQGEIQLQIVDEKGNGLNSNSKGGGIVEKDGILTDICTEIFDPFEELPQKVKLRVLGDSKVIMEMEFDVE